MVSNEVIEKNGINEKRNQQLTMNTDYGHQLIYVCHVFAATL